MYESEKSIVIIGPNPPPIFGVSYATKVTVEGLRGRGLRVAHLDTKDNREIRYIGKFDLINIYLAFYHFYRLIKLLIRENTNVLYLPISQGKWGFLRDFGFIIIGKFFGKKVIIHLRGGGFLDFYLSSNFLLQFLIKFSLKFVESGIVQGYSLKYNFERFLIKKDIFVIPNGLDPAPFRKKIKVHTNHNRIKVLFLGNLFKSKGFIDVIKSIPFVIKEHKYVEFSFIGAWAEGESKSEAREIVETNNLYEYVVFHGPISGDQKYEILKESDIFVFPTYYPAEGHPWVILEAMACGLPIITTDHASIAETVIHEYNGFIITKKNPREIANKILYLIDNESFRLQMGNNSIERFMNYYTEEKFLSNLEKIFTKFL